MIEIANEQTDVLKSRTERAVAAMEDVARKSVICASFVAALPEEVREKNVTKSVGTLANTMPFLYIECLRGDCEKRSTRA